MSDQRKNMLRNDSANVTKHSERRDPGKGYMRGERPRRDRDDDGIDTAGGSDLQRVKRGSRNRGYHEDEVHELQYRGNLRSQDNSEEEYGRRSPPERKESREPYGKRSRIYEVPDDEERNYSEPDYNDDSTMGTENMRNSKTRFSNDQKPKQTGNVEPDYPDDASLDIDQNTGYSETRFYNGQNIAEAGRAEPGNMAIGYTDRGYAPPNYNGYPAPVPMMIDRRADVSMMNIQYQQAGTTWNTQVPFIVQNYPPAPLPKTEEEEEKKPRKVWWYTTSRVFSAILIICNLVSDWLQESDMDDPIGDSQEAIKQSFSKKVCTSNEDLEATKQFLYFTIAGTILAAGQLVNIIYQIVQNHRLPADTEIPEYVDERTEVFLVNAFVEFPQNYLICRWEKNLPEACVECGITFSSKKMKRFMNGFVSLASSLWRFMTHVNISSDGSKCSCSSLFEKCAQRLGNCIKSCLMGCLKCLCPCCCCCMDCKTFLPCCCSYLICKNCKCSVIPVCSKLKCGPGGPSFFGDLATLPTGLVTFLYIYRVLRYFCTLEMTYVVFNFVVDTIIGTVWNFVFSL